MTDHLELILADLRQGLRRRAAHRRRARTAAASFATAAALAAVGVSTVGLLAETGPPARAASDGAAARLISDGCPEAGTALVCWRAERR